MIIKWQDRQLMLPLAARENIAHEGMASLPRERSAGTGYAGARAMQAVAGGGAA